METTNNTGLADWLLERTPVQPVVSVKLFDSASKMLCSFYVPPTNLRQCKHRGTGTNGRNM